MSKQVGIWGYIYMLHVTLCENPLAHSKDLLSQRLLLQLFAGLSVRQLFRGSTGEPCHVECLGSDVAFARNLYIKDSRDVVYARGGVGGGGGECSDSAQTLLQRLYGCNWSCW